MGSAGARCIHLYSPKESKMPTVDIMDAEDIESLINDEIQDLRSDFENKMDELSEEIRNLQNQVDNLEP
jgi:polyhydroxyalkanoate synthesis regulator phasin